jgi:hypothetical protein
MSPIHAWARFKRRTITRTASHSRLLSLGSWVGGASDGNFTAALGVPTLDGLGIDGAGAHTLQEHGLLSSVAPRMRRMECLLETLA